MTNTGDGRLTRGLHHLIKTTHLSEDDDLLDNDDDPLIISPLSTVLLALSRN